MILDFINFLWVKILLSSLLATESIAIFLLFIWYVCFYKEKPPKTVYMNMEDSEVIRDSDLGVCRLDSALSNGSEGGKKNNGNKIILNSPINKKQIGNNA